jgi:zinc protease
MMRKCVISGMAVFLGVFSVCASLAAEQKPLVLPEVTRSSLLNDLQIYVATTPYLGDDMTLGLVLPYGSAFDLATKGGVAYLTSQLLGRATIDLTAKDIQDELNYLNASLQVSCDWDGIRVIMRGRSVSYERCLLLLYRIICEAKFNDDDFLKAQNAVIQQLQAPEDARRRVRSQFEAELFRGTTYGRPMRGTLASVKNITAGDVRFFYKRSFSPDQAALAVVGSAPATDVLSKARRIWGIWVRLDPIPNTFFPAREPGARNIFLEDDPSSPAAQYILGNLWPNREDPLYYAGILSIRLLQERLTKALPTSQLTVAAEGRRRPGPFFIQGQAAADQAVGEISKILADVESFHDSPPGLPEVTKLQDQWIEEFGKGLGSTDGICNAVLDAELYRLGVNYLSTFQDFVRRCSPTMMKDAAKQMVLPGGMILIVRGPAAILQPQLESLGTVQLLKR